MSNQSPKGANQERDRVLLKMLKTPPEPKLGKRIAALKPKMTPQKRRASQLKKNPADTDR